jgi:hypothetical protein
MSRSGGEGEIGERFIETHGDSWRLGESVEFVEFVEFMEAGDSWRYDRDSWRLAEIRWRLGEISGDS